MGKVFLFLIIATFYTFLVSQVDARNIDGAPSLTPIRKGAMKKEGESCGFCFCPPKFTAGECDTGLKCDRSAQKFLPDAPGICRAEKKGAGGGDKAAKSPTSSDDCPRFCTKIYLPVCGTNGKTYGNDCELKMDACVNPSEKIRIAHSGKCKQLSSGVQCDVMCLQNYDPVCGSNGKTYSNECFLGVDNCHNDSEDITVAHSGECKDKVKSDCPRFCIKIYLPVCGTNGKTYGNDCELKMDACVNPSEKIGIAHSGKCKQLSSGAQCDIMCLANYDPVCGSNGKTYSNECFLGVDNCHNDSEDITVAHSGECKDKMKSKKE